LDILPPVFYSTDYAISASLGEESTITII